ncbi:MAG: tyrosinase family protein [Nannocystaceae bacterium]|nr:tyrosinase family protein [Nannocystaceae bacterium]
MGIRKSVANMNDAQRDAFRDALAGMKVVPAGATVSPYDRLVALHGAVMSVRVRFANGQSQQGNLAHGGIGFLPWHRQYLLDFEAELHKIAPNVDLPYWDWSDSDTLAKLFTPAFLGALNVVPAPVGLQNPPPPQPVTNGALFPLAVHPELQDLYGTPLTRRTLQGTNWPPSANQVKDLTETFLSLGTRHELWVFRLLLETGYAGYITASHNAGHNFIGGHMASGFSPNDPVFWLHHANVDRLWSIWQENYRARNNSAAPSDWPLPAEQSPISGVVAPYGQRRYDLMWPWVGQFSGAFGSSSVSPAQFALISAPAGLPEVRVNQVLDLATLNYSYE